MQRARHLIVFLPMLLAASAAAKTIHVSPGAGTFQSACE